MKQTMERTLDNLRAAYDGKIYLDLGLKFEAAPMLKADAKRQGWTIDGGDPESASCTQFVTLRNDRDIHSLTAGGLMAAHAHAVLTVDYKKFADGEDNYISLPQN